MAAMFQGKLRRSAGQKAVALDRDGCRSGIATNPFKEKLESWKQTKLVVGEQGVEVFERDQKPQKDALRSTGRKKTVMGILIEPQHTPGTKAVGEPPGRASARPAARQDKRQPWIGW